MNAQDIITTLRLSPHPEGGYYRQTWSDSTGTPRPHGTCIYFLLDAGKPSHWHKVDAVEIWHFYAGAPLRLKLAETENGPRQDILFGPDLGTGQRPQCIVPKDWWQAAETTGDWTLVGCTVSPGFSFDGFELAPPNFDIP